MPPVTTGLVICLQADSYGALADDTIVTTWTDQSSAGNNGVAHNNPKFRTGRTPMSTPSIQFTGGSGGPYYHVASTTIFTGAGATSAEFFMVLKAAAADNPGPLQVGAHGPFYPHPRGGGGTSTYDGSFRSGSGPRANFANPGVSSWGVYNVSHDGTNLVHRFNGTGLDTTALGFVAPTNTIQIAWYNGAATKWTGEIAELLVYTRSLTSTERDDVYEYLVVKHIDDGTVYVDPPAAEMIFVAPAPEDPVPMHQYPDPADVEVDAPVPALISATLSLVGPADNALLPALRPRFTVAVSSTMDLTVDIQYAVDEDFTAPTSLTVAAPVGQDPLYVTVQATADLTDATAYFWRARPVNGYATGDWTAARTFTTGADEGDALASGTWTVSATATPVPHLWFALPSRGEPGDEVRAYGLGLGSAGSVVLNGVTATVTDWDAVAADADAYTADRVINAETGEVSTVHQVVTFTVPDGAQPGGPLYVVGS